MRFSAQNLRLGGHLPVAVLLTLMSALANSPASAQEEALRTRRVWKGEIGNICCHVYPKPSPDGRYIPGVDWLTGDLAYLDLQEDRWIRATDKGPWAESAQFSMNAIFSPDGGQLAHSWWNDDGRPGNWDLRVEDRRGGNVRVLVPSTISEYSWPLDWSPNGKSIVAVLTPPSASATSAADGGAVLTRLALVPVDGGDTETLKELDPRENSGFPTARFSPNGEWIAYEQFAGDPPFYDIHLLSVDGTVDRPLLRGNGDDRLLDWLPDGSGILLHSERNLTQGIWRLSIQDGLPSGDPELVKGDVWGIFGMGIGPAGLYYMVPTEAPQVYTATLDLDRGELTSPPNPVREITDGAGLYPSWSPDGRQLAFVDRGMPGATRSRLVIQSLETGESHTLSVPIEGLSNLRWDPDGRTVTGIGSQQGTMGFHRFDLQTGEVNILVQMDDLGPSFGYHLSRDGKTLLYSSWSADGQAELRARNLKAGTEGTVATVEGISASVADFPGGERYAVLTVPQDPQSGRVRLLTMNSDGSGVQTLWEGLREFTGNPQIEVTHDGKHILFGVLMAVGEYSLVSFSVETGERKVIDSGTGGDPGATMGSFTLHPDGSRIAFWRGVARGEIWVMEGWER